MKTVIVYLMVMKAITCLVRHESETPSYNIVVAIEAPNTHLFVFTRLMQSIAAQYKLLYDETANGS